MTNRKKAEAIFEAMKKYADYRVCVSVHNKEPLPDVNPCGEYYCHGVNAHHVFVSNRPFFSYGGFWCEPLEEVTGCKLTKYTDLVEDEIRVF